MSTQPETEPKTPPGIVAIYVNAEGRVIASVSDFKPDRPAGFTTYEAQHMRAKHKLARAVMVAYCSPVICNAIDEYDCAQIVGKLKGKTTFIPVGHPESQKG